MSETELNTASHLFDKLANYYDESSLQAAIVIGDDLHVAICHYRKGLTSQRLPPGEGKFTRDLLRFARSESVSERSESQDIAESWATLLLKKYPALAIENPEDAKDLDANPPENNIKLSKGVRELN